MPDVSRRPHPLITLSVFESTDGVDAPDQFDPWGTDSEMLPSTQPTAWEEP